PPMSLRRPPTLALPSAPAISAAIPAAILLALLLVGLPLQARAQAQAQARVANASIERVVTAVAVLHDVRVRLAWVPGADAGELTLQAARVEADDLGYRYRDLSWLCPLQRRDDGGWQCDGEVRSGNAAPLRLA